ncbi:MAG: hypothetical protein ABJA34_13390 [Pseudonocardiales bacterium]
MHTLSGFPDEDSTSNGLVGGRILAEDEYARGAVQAATVEDRWSSPRC